MKTLLMREYIGLAVEIIDAKNESLIGLKGKVIDETKNTFTINVEGKKQTKIVKKGTTFIFKIDNKQIKINGDLLAKRPEERLKLKVK